MKFGFIRAQIGEVWAWIWWCSRDQRARL